MGHFGRKPIRTAWFGLVLPALALNYLGQGAMLLAHPERIENPFFLLYPAWALLPMVLLATVATVIASQAVITGAFSITQQAMQLGLLPRMRVLRTSETEKGQIYIPRVNWLLLVAVVFLVGAVQVVERAGRRLRHRRHRRHGDHGVPRSSSSRGGSGAGRRQLAALVLAPFLLVELVFLSANALKILHGGWVPLTIGAALVTAMWTWRRGSALRRRDPSTAYPWPIHAHGRDRRAHPRAPRSAGRLHAHGRDRLGAARSGNGRVPHRVAGGRARGADA